MKTDKLEQYINGRRDEFDLYEPDPAIWDRVEKRRKPIISMSWKSVAWRAAVIVLVFGFSWMLNDLTDSNKNGYQAGLGEEIAAANDPMMNDLLEAEIYYTSRISLRRDEIASITTDQPEILEEIEQEFEGLNMIFDELKKDLNDNADNQEVIEAMILNYRIKLDILEEMLRLIDQPVNYENDLKQI